MNEQMDFSAFRSIHEIVPDLKKPIKLDHLGKRKQGGKEILYISWTDACKYMDYYASGWFYEVRHIDVIGGKLIVTVRVSIPAKEGIFYREAIGQEDEVVDSWGDSTSNAEAMALRRACAKFGLCQYLYDISDRERDMLIRGQQITIKTPSPLTPDNPKVVTTTTETPDASGEHTEPAPNPKSISERIKDAHQTILDSGNDPVNRKQGESDEDYFPRLVAQYKAIHASEKPKTANGSPEGAKPAQNTQNGQTNGNQQSDDAPYQGNTVFPANPTARSLSDLVTAKQLGMIRAVCREIGIDPDEECEAVLGCKTDELSKKAASAFIQYLKDKPADAPEVPMRKTKPEETGKAATKNQVEILENLAVKTKQSEIDVAQAVSKGRCELFADLLENEADEAIKRLSAKVNAK